MPDDTQVDTVPGSDPTTTAESAATALPLDEDAEPGRRRPGSRRRRGQSAGTVTEQVARVDQVDDEAEDSGTGDGSRRLSLPLVPALAVLLVLLVAACVALWVTRPAESAVRTGDYVGALQAARAGIVDVTSFDYVTLDDDIAQIRSVTTGDLQQESVSQLDQSRQQITDAQAVVNTSVVGAAVGSADDDTATVFAVLQSNQQTSASQQAQVQRYRVEISLKRVDGRWLLSGITGR